MADFLGIQSVINFFHNPGVLLVLKIIYYSAPIWITFILAMLFWNLWITYKRAQFFASQNYVLLEIKLPKEIFKSPIFWFISRFKGVSHISLEIHRSSNF